MYRVGTHGDAQQGDLHLSTGDRVHLLVEPESSSLGDFSDWTRTSSAREKRRTHKVTHTQYEQDWGVDQLHAMQPPLILRVRALHLAAHCC